MIIVSNNDFCVPATLDNRRFSRYIEQMKGPVTMKESHATRNTKTKSTGIKTENIVKKNNATENTTTEKHVIKTENTKTKTEKGAILTKKRIKKRKNDNNS